MHLVQLIGGQIWPNFLPILAFRPSKVTFITSADPNRKFCDSVEYITNACRELGYPFEQKIIRTESELPTISQCAYVLAGISADLYNLTGGTKPMSIAAHAHARAKSSPSFYLDTRREKDHFEFTDTGVFDEHQPSLVKISSLITVRIALMAQGFSVPPYFKIPKSNEISFSTRAAHLRGDSNANRSISNGIKGIRKALFDHRSERILEKRKLRSALQIPIKAEPKTPFHDYLSTAAKEGLIQQLEPENEFLLTKLDPTTANSDKLKSDARETFKLLEGIWFELALFDKLKSEPFFSDTCWSVEADSEHADSIGETDFVAFNCKTFSLHFISCKTTGPHSNALDHIQGLRRRATKEGGKFSKAELWIFSPKTPDSKATLREHCNEQGVQLHIFTEEVNKIWNQNDRPEYHPKEAS